MQKKFILNCLIEFFKLDFFLNGVKKYSHFGGREGRKDFFLFQISNILIFMGLNSVAERFNGHVYLLSYILFMFPPVISSMVRRLHDVGKNGFVLPLSILLGILFFVLGVLFFYGSNVLLGLIAVLSVLILCYPFFLFFKPSVKGENRFDGQKSHPIRHGFMLISFILIFTFFLYLFGMALSSVDVLPQEEALTSEEIKEIDDLIKEQQALK
ncbi:MAG: DUF805 domain-containing protein [Alphaproteobacteria bacterium]|nr:DUF805 domain-containing protein [Alphaproteobacteria bacterium]